MGRIRFNKNAYKDAEHFTMHQRFQELAMAIQRWPKSALIGLRIKEKNELEEKLGKYEEKAEK